MHDQVTANKRRSALVLIAFVALVAIVGAAFELVIGAGAVVFVASLVIGTGVAFLAYRKSDAIALAMSHAQPADPVAHARLHNVVEGLCVAGGLPKPRLYVVDDPAANAFATGRNPQHAALAVTTGLLERMTRIELEGVLAHELRHIKSYDILVSTLAVTLVGGAALASDWALRFRRWGGPRHGDEHRPAAGAPAAIVPALGTVLLVVTPLVAKAMHLAVSPGRESRADVSGVSLTRYPPGLVSALRKLQDDRTLVHSWSKATAHLWFDGPTPQTPEDGRHARFDRLFHTHPPLEERIAALQEL